MYNQEYTELYQPSVTGLDDKVWDLDAIRNSRVYNVSIQSNNDSERVAEPGGSLLGAAHLHGRGVVRDRLAQLRFGATVTNGDWRAIAPGPATCSRSPTTRVGRSR